MPKAIITLTTDFGEKDHFAGAVKGAIYSELETIKIVDISHCISPFHILCSFYHPYMAHIYAFHYLFGTHKSKNKLKMCSKKTSTKMFFYFVSSFVNSKIGSS